MKFIFPQNYDFRSKLFGIFDYSTVLFNLIWGLFIFSVVNLVFHNLNVKVFLFVILYLPVLMFSIIGFNHENILYVISYLLEYLRNPKVYVYRK